MKPITFEQLPQAVSLLFDKLDTIEKLLASVNTNTVKPIPQDEFLSVQEAASFLKLAVPTIHTMVSRAEIPANKAGKKLYFSKDELTDWIKQGRKKTAKELQADADNYLKSKIR
jgi:excisionase family DNA binding protein